MHSLKKTGTDFDSARGMDPKAFFEVMGAHYLRARFYYTLLTGSLQFAP